jgi:hypothetical protein
VLREQLHLPRAVDEQVGAACSASNEWSGNTPGVNNCQLSPLRHPFSVCASKAWQQASVGVLQV